MADDWWASASKTHQNNNSNDTKRRPAPISAPPAVATTSTLSTDKDPLLAGLSSAPLSRPETPAAVARATIPPPPTASASARQRRAERPPTSSGLSDKLSGLELHEIVERATGHARPPGKQDTAAVNILVRSVRLRETRLETVLKTLSISTDGKGGSTYNIRVLNLFHILLSAGAHALPHASNGVCGATPAKLPASLRIITEAHTASRKARGAIKADVLGTTSYRDAKTIDTNDKNEAAIYAAECYSVMLARRLTFAAQFSETEFNYSLDRWYRRLGIENRVDSLRAGYNNQKQHRLLASDTRLLVINLVTIASRCVILLSRSKAQREAVISVLSEACNAYAFSEYIRAKSGVGKPPIEEQRLLQEAVNLVVGGGGASALCRYANIDEKVAEVCVNDVGEVATGVRVDSKHRRDIVCTFSSFTAMHAALDPFLKIPNAKPQNNS